MSFATGSAETVGGAYVQRSPFPRRVEGWGAETREWSRDGRRDS